MRPVAALAPGRSERKPGRATGLRPSPHNPAVTDTTPPEGGGFPPHQTPLFPLQTVLFPGGLLPLRIFEVRYLDMIGRCFKAGQPFGVVCLTEGRDVQQPAAAAGAPSGDAFVREAFYPVGTLATITSLDRPQPGLMMIRCTGTQRFRLKSSEKLKHGLWVGDIEPISADATVAVPEDLAHTRSALQKLLLQIEQSVEEPSQMPVQGPYLWDDCGWLANRWCELLPLSPEVKHRFMALDNPLLRLELVADALDQMGFKLP